ncbi:class I SAM-dependent methyltransferase [Tindallia californiensis]|uniref:Ubiquinone/menaquinone biosynthesis C-methylase UbiE n=1 Tax=Tindallia californiensis TaxID=159292 RepID=A0A1H3PQP7_9FIRM|nr:class I SAM-dependent methyltransferase [Tindallia californiensis]SDZ03303.1 Ubiquinone/menaquinone biosynthesis C-methylase UbiE [Tindallia californiensis]
MKREREIKMKDAIQQCWDKNAIEYDEGYDHGIKSNREKEAWMKWLAQRIGDESKIILDIGTGTGNLALMLAEMGHYVKGIDVSAAMLEIAIEKSVAYRDKITYEQQDVHDLALEVEARYDAVVGRNVLWTLTDPQQALQGWYRVIKPGGMFIMIDGNWFTPTYCQKWGKRLGGILQSMGMAEKENSSYSHEMINNLPLIEQDGVHHFIRIAEKVGFESVTQHPLKPLDQIINKQMSFVQRLINAHHRYGIVGYKARGVR